MNNIFIGKKIKEARNKASITQQCLADKINKTESSIRKYEKGLVDIPLNVLNKIADALDVSVNDLLSENNLTAPTDKFYEWESFSDATQKFVRILDILGYQVSLKADTVVIDSNKYSLKEFEKTAQKVYGKISEQTIHEIGYINAVMDFMGPLQENE